MLDFLGIGAQKSGTTWLFERLGRHPEIHFPHIKEISFWNAHYPRSLKDPHYKRNIHWYRSLFNHWDNSNLVETALPISQMPSITYQRTWFDHVMGGLDRLSTHKGARIANIEPAATNAIVEQKQGEISPTYCYFDNPGILPAIYNFAPDVRIIYIMRHPINRAWSAAQMGLKRAEMSPEEASDQWYIDHFHSHLSLKYGDYERAISDWQAVFPKEQILLLRFEDIARDPHRILKKCCEHIGVRAVDYFDRIPVQKLSEKVFAGSGENIRPSLLPALHEIYDPRILRLKESSGIDYTHFE